MVLVPVNILQALQHSSSLVFNPAPTQELVVSNSPAENFSGPPMALQHLQFNIQVSNAGINISFSADSEMISSMHLNEPLSYVPITNFLSSRIMPTLATFGPWAHGYGIKPASLNIELVVTNTEDGQLEASATVTSFDAAGTYGTSTHLWSLADTESPNVQANTVTITELNDDLVAPSDDLALTGSDLVPGASSAGVSKGKRGKNKAPISVMQVRRSNRSNKYDGFKVPLISDSKAKTSKVKPRVIPNMASAVVITELSDDHDAEVPPPLSIHEIQQIGSTRCAIPPEELTEEVLLADQEGGPSNA